MVRAPREPPRRPLACAAGVNPKVTLGLNATRLKKLRPFNGRSMMRLSSITVPTVAVSVDSNAALATTSSVCVACPTARAKSTRAVCCTWSSMSFVTAVWKPAAVAFTWYLPGIRPGKL